MTEDWLDKSPAELRLALWLEERLETGNETQNIARLADALGYKHDSFIKMWVAGKSKVPLKHITAIAHFFGFDAADVLPYWLAQECPDDEQLYRAGTRMLSAWEWMLVSVARDIYCDEVE